MRRVVRVRGAGAVRVARDDLLPFSNFVVHRVAQCARDNKQEENETTAKDEDAARDIETSAYVRHGADRLEKRQIVI